VREHSRYVRGVDCHGLVHQIGTLERDLVQQLLHYGVQTSGSDVFGPIVDDGRKIRDSLDRIVRESDFNSFGIHQRDVLLDERAARLGQNPNELLTAERLELDANREATLKLRNEI